MLSHFMTHEPPARARMEPRHDDRPSMAHPTNKTLGHPHQPYHTHQAAAQKFPKNEIDKHHHTASAGAGHHTGSSTHSRTNRAGTVCCSDTCAMRASASAFSKREGTLRWPYSDEDSRWAKLAATPEPCSRRPAQHASSPALAHHHTLHVHCSTEPHTAPHTALAAGAVPCSAGRDSNRALELHTFAAPVGCCCKTATPKGLTARQQQVLQLPGYNPGRHKHEAAAPSCVEW